MKKLAFAITATSGAAAFLTHHDAQASTQHTVQSGESLWSIAQKYNTSVESIKQNNQLDNNLVFPGQVISVGGSDAQNTSNTSPQAGSASSHTVQAGESLNIIASRYGVSVDQLMAANNLRGYLIMPNQTLQILMADQVVQHQQLQQVAMAMHHLLITKIYTLLVNVHGTYLIVVLKLVVQLAHIGQTLSIGLVTQLMMVTK